MAALAPVGTVGAVNDVVSTAESEVLARVCASISVLRLLLLVWASVVVAIDAQSGVLEHPTPAVVLLAVLAAYSLWWWRLAVSDLGALVRVGPRFDAMFAAAVYVVDQFAYAGPHPQTFASAWPLTAVIAVGVLRGGRAGALVGAGVGAVNVAAAAVFIGLSGNLLAVSGTAVLLTMSGWVAGTVTARLRSDAVLIARAEAREELARDLHDGVLQTLAVVQRRSDDVDLVALARAQEADLRRLISSPVRPGVVSVAGELRSRAPMWCSTFGVDVDVVVIDDGAAAPASSDALVAAASEAVVNAAKHSGAERVTVSVDRGEEGGTVVVVHDEGRGFDPQRVAGGVGLDRSIRDRVGEAGGTVTVRSAPGRGCEVTLWAP